MSGEARRRLLWGAIGAGAALLGGGVAWRRMHAEGAGGADALGELDFWGRQFDTPAGGTLRLADYRGRKLLVNFWATWCAPCVEEMPLLDAFARQNAANGWQVLGLAIDQPSSVRQFLARIPVSFPIGLAGLEGTELGRSLGNQVGGLPFTVLVGPDGRVRERKMGQVTTDELERWKATAGA